MKQDRTIGLLIFSFSAFVFFIATAFGKVHTLIMDPVMTTIEYLAQWPSVTLGSVIIQQPSSSIIILVLAILTVALGLRYRFSDGSRFKIWLGINFIFWGVGALLAGLSYQAFGYALKCVNLPACQFTDWVELLYMLFTVYSLNALLMAYAYLMKDYRKASRLKWMAVISVLSYSILQAIGILIPVKFLLTYEFMLVFLSPNLILFMVISYKKRSEKLHDRLFKLWIAFIGVNLAYFVALFADIGTLIQNATGFWFNENDTLHVLLILWMIAWWILIPATGTLQSSTQQDNPVSL